MLISFNGEEWLKLSSKVNELTRSGSLTWEIDDSAPDPNMAFKATTPSGSTYYLYPEDFDGRFPFIFSVWRGQEKLATFTTIGFNNEGPFDSFEEEASSILANLYPTIGRLVSGAPQTVESLLAELDQLDPRGDVSF